MKKPDPTQWERLEQVIRATHHTVNSFAKHIGLPRGENLYQIKRGNNRISLDVARRIHEHFPGYSIAWLMFGEIKSPVAPGEETYVVHLPVYRNLWMLDAPKAASDAGELILSAGAANGAECAVAHADPMLAPWMRNSLLLLRSCGCDEIVYGNLYLVHWGRTRLFRIVREDGVNPGCLRLSSPNSAELGDLSLPRDRVASLWLVCGAVCRLER